MRNSNDRLSCRLDDLSPEVREQQRNETLKRLGLLETETIPVFDEATQTVARFLEVPICILSIMVGEDLWLKSAVGLSSLGLMNPIASSRRISRQEAFSTYVIDSQQNLIINDTNTNPTFARSILAQHYGIRAYLGTPLITLEGHCVGALAVKDLTPRPFTVRDLEFLVISARWCLREFERDHLLKIYSIKMTEPLNERSVSNPKDGSQSISPSEGPKDTTAAATIKTSSHTIKLKLLRQLTQELRTPLTSVIGMASVLRGEAFGHLTSKQKEYLEIIHTSGQQMNSLVDEILKLGVADENLSNLQLTSVNIEMLCQQALNSLGKIAQQKRQVLRLSIEPGKRIWLLDKEKVRNALYYLIISVIASAETDGEVRIHVSRRSQNLNIAVWVSHPWLSDGLSHTKISSSSIAQGLFWSWKNASVASQSKVISGESGHHILTYSSLEVAWNQLQSSNQKPDDHYIQELLGLLLGCHLAEIHRGKIVVQSLPESGYRYVLMLPGIEEGKE
jgi:hypothetical protein